VLTVIKIIIIKIGLYLKYSWNIIKIQYVQCKIKYSVKLHFVFKDLDQVCSVQKNKKC